MFNLETRVKNEEIYFLALYSYNDFLFVIILSGLGTSDTIDL